MLLVGWKSFLWFFTMGLIEHYFFDVSVFLQFVSEFRLVAVIFKTTGSRVKFVVFAIDDFSLLNDSVVDV